MRRLLDAGGLGVIHLNNANLAPNAEASFMQNFQKRRTDGPAEQARNARDRAFAVAMRRKEDYLGARVPKELKDRVIERARELDLPVSLLIRKVLEEAFGADAATAVDGASDAGSFGGPATENDRFHGVLVWKGVELKRTHTCDRCGTSMSQHESAFMGFLAGSEGVVIVCNGCKGQIQGRM